MDINTIERQSGTPGLTSGTMLVIATVVGGGMFSHLLPCLGYGSPVPLLFFLLLPL
jgi:tyrosine permease